ncbi:TonB-dependent receptor [uncultured Alistipes sp.]|uniref:TonB-dependent receptor n=2 Tax=uncultured Alistipes sp. TaxID=538949 RepID=UPI0025F5238A|nr:TonB-dependent receptor [uncultured Alistipes sp.]
MHPFRHILLWLALLGPCAAAASGRGGEIDTLVTVEDVRITVRSLKEARTPIDSPVAVSHFGREEAERQRIATLRDLSALVPNLHVPDYGSRMTSSVYVRGLGARIDQPVLGLLVDDIPVMNKDAYDFDVTDILGIEVLRGPQSTLYGRNTMGGVMRIRTRSPLDGEGVRAGVEYGNGNTLRARASGYFRATPRFGIGAAGYYTASDGFFRNAYDGSPCDRERSGGGSLKLQGRFGRTEIRNTLRFSRTDQGGYPYASVRTGLIACNDPCAYERTSLTEGLTVRHDGGRIALESVTSYQYLDDRMTLDQDFRPESYFTLVQDRREHALTQEFVLRSSGPGRYRWLVGAFGFYKRMRMQAPVTFGEQGIRELIVDNVRDHTGYAPVFYHDEFPLESDFENPVCGAALYHESSLELGRWQLTAGLRVEHERARLDYRSSTLYPCRIQQNEIAPFAIDGRLKRRFTEWMPRFSVLVHAGRTRMNTLYLSAAKGFKAGGFNTQMFSDVLQNVLMEKMGAAFDRGYDPDRVVGYDPEESWNYELGGHLHLAKGDLQIDWALFWIDCRNQQLTVFPEGRTTGRMMTNAGRTRSLGGELSATARPWPRLTLQAAYGYTRAEFRRFRSGDDDFSGKRVPYAPEHTLSARVRYEIPVRGRLLERIVPSVDLQAVGPIRWNEANTLVQPLYQLTGLSVRFEQRHYALDLWCRNLTGTRYDTFYFLSVGEEFVQRGRPRTFGVALQLDF